MVARQKIAYMFPGQGAQYVGMGKDLYDEFPQAREVFDKANEVLDFDLKEICFNGPSEKLSTTGYSQPAIFAVSIAALYALKSKLPDLNAEVALGLSLGEYSALVSAGSIEFIDALRLVRARGRFMEEASKENPGKMLSILGLDRDIVEEICNKSGCQIANLNCPGQIVVSGKDISIKKTIDLAQKKGAKRTIILDVSGPFHSSLMEPAAVKLKAYLDNVTIKKPSFGVINNVNASYEHSPERIRENLIAQLTHRTNWEDSIRLLVREGIQLFLEIGPGKVLKGLLRRIDPTLSVYTAGSVKEIEELKGIFLSMFV